MISNRRIFIKGVLASAVISALPGCHTNLNTLSPLNLDADWQKAKRIREQIKQPEFLAQDFLLTDYFDNQEFLDSQAVTDCTSAFKLAINACSKAGGGRVVVPAGTYHTGPIHLLSNINLHLLEGALVKFIPEPERYLPAVITRWEGLEHMGYSPLIYAYEQENIAITGKGVLDGSADNATWWPWKGPHKEAHWQIIPDQDQKPARMALMQDAENNVPVEKRIYADGAFLRPPFIQPYKCKNILIQDVTIKNSPFWLVNPVLCHNVTVKGANFLSHGPNSDGCDPESCDHVLIEDCTFDTGDDCIAIKSGRNADGRRLNIPCQNIVIANCNMREGHGGVVIGSEISGGVNNVFVENCQMDSPELERAIRIKTNSIRGGLIEHLRYRNIQVGKVKEAVVINFYYEEGDAGDFDPTVRDIVIEDLNCQQIFKRPLNIQGFSRKPISDIHLINCHFNQAHSQSIVRNVENFTTNNVSINDRPIHATELIEVM
ncbi:glycoside hydrolase family 28 protein [Paraglaciecola aquimarina]|uniref:Glycoside hydrolase family 28 protein n=1 Tax=Paraglaciecola algarum TaxID=3050085 RepID=A0ABS9DC53_9ALTE|nr:glycoside hydrolase family 28 protein [Paraglaciecola sp. G1-23]MCF2949598.1 glycoside hydrolase family 28 protein [Paraglaciecola sp. G1-23]